MKRLLSLLLVIAMLLGVCTVFTACSDTGSSQDDDDKKKDDKEEEVEPTLVFKGLKIVLPEEYELEDKNEYGENSGYVRFTNDDYMVDIQCGPMEYELEGMDAEEYREKREDSLRRYARKKAQQVLKARRRTTLEPMNAYERHVIHSALQDMDNITTHSTGTEPNRRVVIEYVR